MKDNVVVQFVFSPLRLGCKRSTRWVMEKDALLRSIAVAVCNNLIVAFVSCTLLVNDTIINNNMCSR